MNFGKSYSELLNVPVFRQTDGSRCGPASIKSVLYYYGIDATEDQITLLCNHTYQEGCSNEGMVSCLKEFNLGAKLLTNQSIDDLIYWTKHKVPVIVDWFSGDSNGSGYGHASVVIGVDETHVFLVDPLKPNVSKILIPDFKRIWFDWDNDNQLVYGMCIVVYPKRLEV